MLPFIPMLLKQSCLLKKAFQPFIHWNKHLMVTNSVSGYKLDAKTLKADKTWSKYFEYNVDSICNTRMHVMKWGFRTTGVYFVIRTVDSGVTGVNRSSSYPWIFHGFPEVADTQGT